MKKSPDIISEMLERRRCEAIILKYLRELKYKYKRAIFHFIKIKICLSINDADINDNFWKTLKFKANLNGSGSFHRTNRTRSIFG